MSWLSKKIPTILGLLLLFGGAGAYFYFFQDQFLPAPEGVVPEKVRISNIADNKFSVSWVTSEATIGEIEYGVVGEKLTSKASDERDSGSSKGSYFVHHVNIEGLQPSTAYAFRILSGDKPARFDNRGSPYTATTGPVIGETPTSENFYGKVELASKLPAGGAIVYLTLPSAQTASTVVNASGNYAFTLSTIRATDGRSYVKVDPSTTVASITVESGKQSSVATVSLVNSAPVPTITLGKNEDFLEVAQEPAIAEVTPEETTEEENTNTEEAETPSIFNVEPLSNPDINQVSSGSVVILNPKETGEVLTTLRPEFRGTGPAGTTLSIALTGQKAISETIKIATDGTWSWAPVIDLKAGAQTISISYLDSSGASKKVSRQFSATASADGLDPAFVATPSATTQASATPTPSPSVSPSPREAMPATDTAVPVTGVIENTLLTAALGIVIMVIGGALLLL